MKKLILFTILILACSIPMHAKSVLSAASTDCSVSSSCLIVPIANNQGGTTFTVTANASSNTIQFEVTSDPAATNVSGLWVAALSTPSGSTTGATSTTSTGSWQFTIRLLKGSYANVYAGERNHHCSHQPRNPFRFWWQGRGRRWRTIRSDGR